MQDLTDTMMKKIEKVDLTETEANEIQLKRTYMRPEKPDWLDIEKCVQLLTQGIKAVKYNYSNNKTKEVIIKCSTDLNSMTYESTEKSTGIMARLGYGTRSIPFKTFHDIIYGGTTSTF